MEPRDIKTICGKYYLLLNSDSDTGSKSNCFLIKIKEIEELNDYAGYSILFDHICGNFDQIILNAIYSENGCRGRIGYKNASHLLNKLESNFEKQLKYGEAVLNVK